MMDWMTWDAVVAGWLTPPPEPVPATGASYNAPNDVWEYMDDYQIQHFFDFEASTAQWLPSGIPGGPGFDVYGAAPL